jgi:ubiquinone/menaquinone biosynthesis C-methylase UbiE
MDAAQVKADFEGVAGEWDSMRLAWYDERVIEELAHRTHVRRSSIALDVGTGTGFVTAGLAPRVAHAVAVDQAPAGDAVMHRVNDVGRPRHHRDLFGLGPSGARVT